MFVGKFNGKPCVTSAFAANNSLCVTGLSGTGKTSRLNQIELASAGEGNTVLVLDMNQTHTEAQVFPYIQKDYEERANRIHAMRDGLGLNLFRPMKSYQRMEEPFVQLVNSAVQSLSSSQGMGTRQISTLREAVIEAVYNLDGFHSEAEALAYSLLKREDSYGEAVYHKLWTLLNCGVLRPSLKSILKGSINIIDLSGTDIITQTALAEIFLSDLWRKAQFGNLLEEQGRLVVVLDEFQNLSMKKDSVLRSLLREGRKFGISLVLATQTLDVFQRDILTVLNQAATKLYFRPALNEVQRVVKEITQDNPAEWVHTLLGLRVGESIGLGELCVNGMEIRRPILLC